MRYDIEGLASELEVGLDSIVGLYESFIVEMKEEIEEMKIHLEKSDWIMLERVIHNIKGVSANLCILDIFSEAEKFDSLLKKNETSDASIYVNKLIALINASETEIKGFFLEKGFSI
jgi:HPt (histidine-containing phosphotransfer) domain-containing protein